MIRPKFIPKLPLTVGRSPPRLLALSLDPAECRPTTPNGVQIQSAVFPQYNGQTDRYRRWDRRHHLYQYQTCPLTL